MEFFKQFLNQEYGLYSFSGRLSRTGFFIGLLLLWIFTSLVMIPATYAIMSFSPQLLMMAGNTLGIWLGLLTALYVFILVNTLVLVLAAAVRRLRDSNVSPVWLLAAFLPFIGEAIIFCQLVRRPVEVHNEEAN